MRTQDLRDSPRAREQYVFFKRGWTRRVDWELSIARKIPAEFRCKMRIGGEDERGVQLSLAFLWVSLFLTFKRVLPESMAVGWYERNGVKNPLWHEDSMGRAYGFYYWNSALVLLWNSSICSSGRDRKRYGFTKFIYMPWDYSSSILHEVQCGDRWVPYSHYHGHNGVDDGRDEYTAPYTYQLKNGEVQHREASFYVERREWRWRIFQKLRIGPAIKSQTISVSFSDEVGERTGSWKGGCTGCSYEMKPGELPIETLRRMERERKFE